MRKLNISGRLPTLLGALVLAGLSTAALALADVIIGDANSVTSNVENSVTVSPGGSGSGKFALVVSDNAIDPVNGCNAGTSTSRPSVTLNVSSNKSWLTLTQSTVTVTGCDTGTLADGLQNAATVNYSVAASAPANDTATVTAAYQSGGASGGTYTPGSFQVKTPAVVDTTPPVITPNVQGTLGDNSWYTSNVTISFTVTDSESTVTSKSAGCDGGTVTSDTAGTTFTCNATSAGGSNTKSVSVKRDSTAPVIVRDAAADGCDAAGDNGWCRGEQTAGFSASDGLSGLVAGDSPHQFTKSSSTQGAAVQISSGTLKDKAGNEASAIDAGPYKIDSTAPVIDGSASPAPNSSGWNKADVTVAFDCGDTGSGIASCGPDETLQDEGRNQSVTGMAKDQAGNSAVNTVSGIDIDKTGPSMPNAGFDKTKAYTDGDGVDWYTDSVTVSYSDGSDPDLNDPRSVPNKAGSGIASYSASNSLSTSGRLDYEGQSTDRADNASATRKGTVKVDADAPSLQVSGCPTTVIVGAPTSLTVSASDGQSGLATDPSGTVALDTSTVGAKTRTVTATDNVGHQVTRSCNYSVVYDWTGFLAPIDNPSTGKLNGAKAGSSVPVKFKLGGYQGLSVIETGYPKSAVINCGSAPVDVVPDSELAAALITSTAGGSSLSYDALSDEYTYVWKTDKAWANQCRQLVLKLKDGQTKFVNFKAMK